MERVGLQFYGDERDAVQAADAVDHAVERVQRRVRVFGRDADDAGQHVGRFSRGMLAGSGIMGGYGRAIAFASSTFLGGAGLVAGIRLSIGAASNLNEQTAKSAVVFGDAAAQVEKWSKSTVNSMGLASDQALEMASSFGALLRPLGETGKEAADQSTKLTQLGADLASFYNTNVQDALDAIKSGLVGEVEPLRRYGVLLSETRVQQVALAMAHKTTASQLTQQEKLLARQAILWHDTAQAQGDFGRTSGGLANQQRILSANIRQMAIGIGQVLIPDVLKVVAAMNQWLSKTENQQRVVDALRHAVDVAHQVVAGFVTVAREAASVAAVAAANVGGWKNALTLMIGAWVGFKAAGVGAAVAVSTAQVLAAGITSKAWKAALISTGWGALAVAAGLAASYAITHWEQVKGWFDSFWITLKEGFDVAWDYIKDQAYRAALAVVEPFSHLPGFMGQWARDAKEQLEQGLGDIEADMNDHIDNITKAWQKGGEDAAAAWGMAWKDAQSFVGPLPTDSATAGLPAVGDGFASPVPQGVPRRIIGTPGVGTHDQKDWQSANALDIAVAAGTPVFAVEAGTISKTSGTDPSKGATSTASGKTLYGFSVTLDGDSGNSYFYTHLDNVAVRAGDSVDAGTVLGYVAAWKGGTPHVHFATSRGNPAQFTDILSKFPTDASGAGKRIVPVVGQSRTYATRVGGPTPGLAALQAIVGGSPAIDYKGHVDKSYHYSGQALDIGDGGNPAGLIDDWNYLFPLRNNLAQLIWRPQDGEVQARAPGTPGGYYWGVSGKATGHTDHIHVAFTGTVEELQRVTAGKLPSGTISPASVAVPDLPTFTPTPTPKAKAKPSITELTGATQLAIAGAEAMPAGVAQLNAQIDAYGLAVDELTRKMTAVKDKKVQAELVAAIGDFRKKIAQAQEDLVGSVSDVPLGLQAKLLDAQQLTGKKGIVAQMRVVGEILAEFQKRLGKASGKDLVDIKGQVASYRDQLIELTKQLYPPVDMAPAGVERSLLGRLRSILKQITSGQAIGFSPRLSGALAAQTKKLIAGVTKAASDGFTQAEATAAGERVDDLAGRFGAAIDLGPIVAKTRNDLTALVGAFSRLPNAVRRQIAPDIAAANKLIGSVVTQKDVDAVTARMAKIADAIAKQIQKATDAVSYAKDRLGSAFGTLLDKALEIFDAKTQALLDSVRVTVAGIGSIAAGEQTPAEAELARRAAEKAEAERVKRLADLNDQIAKLSAPTNLERAAGESAEEYRRRVEDAEKQRREALEQAQQALQDELFDQETSRLERQAQAERTAVDRAIESKRREIEAQRALEKQALQDRINDELERWRRGEETAETAQRNILGILNNYGINFNVAGLYLGNAFADGFNGALQRVADRIAELLAAQQALAQQTGAAAAAAAAAPSASPGGGTFTPAPGSDPAGAGGLGGYIQIGAGPYGSRPMFAGGGRVPGRYMGRDDTVLSWLTPGEEVIDRTTVNALRSFLASGGGGGHTFIFQGHVWDKDELVRELRDELSRLGGVTPGGIFGGRA